MDAKTAAAASIDDDIASQPIPQRIRAIVREEAPDAEETINCRMPANMPGGALFCGVAFKKPIGIHSPVHGGAALLQAPAPYRGRWRKLSFPRVEAVPYAPVRRLARQRVKENVSKALERRTE